MDWSKLNPFSRKENTPVINTGNNIAPNFIDGKWFYPLNIYDDQNDIALIKMYNELPEVSAPINYIIDKTSTIPLIHQRKSGDKWIDIENSEVIKLLNDPNYHENGTLYRQNWMLNYIVLGNAYQNKITPVGFSKPKEIFILPSDNTKPVMSKEQDFRLQRVVYYETSSGSYKTNIEPINVEHSRISSLSNKSHYLGRSRLMAAILTSESLRYNYETRVSIYGSRGAMMMITPSRESVVLTEEQAKAIHEKYNNKYGVTRGKSPSFITNIPLNAQNLSPDIAGLQLTENGQRDFKVICGVLAFPPALIYDDKTSTYNNMEKYQASFYENVSMPLNTTFCESLHVLFNLPENERIYADYSGIAALQKSENDKVNIASKMWNDGVLTEDEYRSQMNFDSLGNGNKRKEEVNAGTNQSSTGGN